MAPAVAFADTAGYPVGSAGGTTCQPVAPAPTGIQAPTGADAATYTYNSCTGLWENQYYTWSPATQTATPKTPLVYTCDQTTWTWLTNIWTYNAAARSYYQAPTHATVLPAGATVDPSSLNPCAPLPPQPTLTAGTTTGANDLSNTAGPSTDSGTNANNNTTANMTNQVFSGAGSGDALVSGNTTAGNATSGNASAMATLVNSVQSSSALTDGTAATFVATINGDVQGDLIIDPSQLQPASTSAPLANSNTTVTNQTTGQINNTVKLTAATGNATVDNNTSAGSATTGNATAVANVVNLLNSYVSAGRSFIGVININGNLHGNILLPAQLLDQLVASNAPSTTVSLTPSQASNLGITNTNSFSTTNQVTSSATSGSAAVSQNTSAGSATSGSASTQVRVFNLTNSEIIGANCLLVFVNVSGTWIGVIFNAPVGTTAAALGSGLSGSSAIPASSTTVTNTTNDAINNTIDVSATSGNAAVTHNTQAGNATSGNANTAVNLLNMDGSEFSLSGWFGILFINIFGDWYGSLGAYNPVIATGSHTTSGGTVPQNRPQVFQYVPQTESTASSNSSDIAFRDLAAKLGDSTGSALSHLTQTRKMPPAPSSGIPAEAIGGIIIAAGLMLFVAERLMVIRQTRLGQL